MNKKVQWALVALFAVLIFSLLIGIARTENWEAAPNVFQTAIVPLLAVALGSWLTQRTTQSNQMFQLEADKAQMRAAKFEDLIEAIHENDEWTTRKGNHYAFDKADPGGVPPVDRAHVLAAVYFPTLVNAVSAYRLKSKTYLLFFAKA